MSGEKWTRRDFLKFGAVAVPVLGAGGFAVNRALNQDALRKELNEHETVTITYGTYTYVTPPDMMPHKAIDTYRIPTALAELKTQQELSDPVKVARAFGRRLGPNDANDMRDDTVLGYYEHHGQMEPITAGNLRDNNYLQNLLDVITKGGRGAIQAPSRALRDLK